MKRRQRAVMATDSEWDELKRRAQDAGVSRFKRLTTEPPEPEPPDGQEELLRKVELFDRFVEALLARLPGTEMSMPGAFAFLVRERGAREHRVLAPLRYAPRRQDAMPRRLLV